MDVFALIQHFFTRLNCQECGEHFAEDDIELVDEAEGLFIVHVGCHHCGHDHGTAAVGVQGGMDGDDDELDMMDVMRQMMGSDNDNDSSVGMLPGRSRRRAGGSNGSRRHTHPRRRFQDPEITDADRLRLRELDPISQDDVIAAHNTIQALDSGWMSLIPPEIRERYRDIQTEVPTD